jgi:transcriptional regulator with PAS, ATPase and Fis domain
MLGRTIREVLGQDAYEPRHARIEAVLRGEPMRFEVPTPGRMGQRRETEVHYLPRRDATGEVDGFYAVVVDLTEQKTIQRSLQEAREAAEREAARTGTILSQLAEGVIVTDQDGRITFVNEAAERIHGVMRLHVAAADHSESYGLFTEDGLPYPPEELPLTRASLRGETVEGARCASVAQTAPSSWAVGSARPIARRTASRSVRSSPCATTPRVRTAEAELRHLNQHLEAEVAQRTAERKLLADVFEGTDAMMSVVGPALELLAFNRAYADEVERLGGRRPAIGDRVTDIYADLPDLAAGRRSELAARRSREAFSVIQELGDPRPLPTLV